MNYIDRPIYLNRLIEHKDVDLVKIVTGIRRSGKSSLLYIFHEYLLASGIQEEQIIHMNLESLQYRNLKDYLTFYDYVSERMTHDQTYYLIFDELQVIDGWEKAIESFRLDYKVDIYITGSNAYLLSSEFSTLLSGRYIEIRMLPLSFQEFLNFYEFPIHMSIEDRFQKYLQFGGMPILREYQFNESRSMEALEGIYSTVILRDILQRNHTSDQLLLQKVVMFLCSNIGNLTSPNKIGTVLSSEGTIRQKKINSTIAGKTMSKYIDMLKSAYIFFSVGRYNIKGKELLKTLEKNYIIDLGFRHMLLGYRDTDRGHILENVVYLELLRREYRVYIGKINELEIDFIAEKASEKLYIQVSESLAIPEVKERELKPFYHVDDHYTKMVLSMDRSYEQSYNGIKIVNLIDWLLEKY